MNLESCIRASMQTMPCVEGPVEETPESYPFCAMNHSRTPLNVADYGYWEEEYFLSGKANVYDADADDKLILKAEGLPYKNRILVRRPSDPAKFSGRVYVDILNATQGYDIEDQWHRTYLWCMENGHAYVGITSKPINVQSLKNFDYYRYRSLNWPSKQQVPSPTLFRSATLPGTEEGLVWDIISQTVWALRHGGENNCLGGLKPTHVYLTGQSQSGAYLNTYVSYFDSFLEGSDRTRLFDGYLNIVGALVQRSLCQADNIGPLKLSRRKMHACATPYICLSSEADLTLFSQFLPDVDLLSIKIDNSDTLQDKCRYYEFAGSPHTDIICPILTDIEDIRKTGQTLPNLSQKLLSSINDFPMDIYVCGMLEQLHRWAVNHTAPVEVPPLTRKDGKLERDDFGNAMGGLRTPFVDLPIGQYIAINPDDPEGICGKIVYFTKDQFRKLYGTQERYVELFDCAVQSQIADGWISENAGARMCRWSREAVQKLL